MVYLKKNSNIFVDELSKHVYSFEFVKLFRDDGQNKENMMIVSLSDK